MLHLVSLPVNSSLHFSVANLIPCQPTCKQFFTPRCCRYDTPRQPTCKQPFTPPVHFSKLRQSIWPTASGMPPAQKNALVAASPTTYLPYKIQKRQDTLYPFTFFDFLATFAIISTWDGQNRTVAKANKKELSCRLPTEQP